MGESGEDFDTKSHEDFNVNFLCVMLEHSCHFKLNAFGQRVSFVQASSVLAHIRLRRSVWIFGSYLQHSIQGQRPTQEARGQHIEVAVCSHHGSNSQHCSFGSIALLVVFVATACICQPCFTTSQPCGNLYGSVRSCSTGRR